MSKYKFYLHSAHLDDILIRCLTAESTKVCRLKLVAVYKQATHYQNTQNDPSPVEILITVFYISYYFILVNYIP